MSKLAINFYANVSEQSAQNLINWVYQQLAQQNPQDPYDELIIQISSSGGSSDHGMLLYNFLKQLSITKTTIGMGNVDSAAVMIFASGDTRLAAPSCRFVLHEARATINGEFNSTKLAELANITKRITQDYVGVISTVTGKSKVLIANKVRAGVALSSEEAKRLGLVTNINDQPHFQVGQGTNVLVITNPQNNLPNLVGLPPQLLPMAPPGVPPLQHGQYNPQVII